MTLGDTYLPHSVDFGGDQDNDPDPGFLDLVDHNPDPGLFKGFFIYSCDSYRQPRVNRENPQAVYIIILYYYYIYLHARYQ